MSMIQKEISDFRVQAYHQGAFQTVSKADVLGKWAVFFFYPADFTFVCPTELEDLANKYADFQAAGCQVYAVSCDTHFVHKAWHDASERIQKIQYPMLADPRPGQGLRGLYRGRRRGRAGHLCGEPRGEDRGL